MSDYDNILFLCQIRGSLPVSESEMDVPRSHNFRWTDIRIGYDTNLISVHFGSKVTLVQLL